MMDKLSNKDGYSRRKFLRQLLLGVGATVIMPAFLSSCAAEAGKHVISEKPMATSVEDCQTMITACRNAGRKLSVGYRLHFEPYNEEIMRLGQNEVFGPIQKIEGRFGNNVTGRDPNIWRLDKELSGGGAMMDVGIYVVQASIYAHGALPIAVTAREETTNTEFFDEVEEFISWQLEFPDWVVAYGETSYSAGGNYFRAEARDGWFGLEPAYWGDLQGETSEGVMDFPQVTEQTLQMDAFADCIFNDRESSVPGELGLRDMKILTAIYEAAKTGQRVELDWT